MVLLQCCKNNEHFRMNARRASLCTICAPVYRHLCIRYRKVSKDKKSHNAQSCLESSYIIKPHSGMCGWETGMQYGNYPRDRFCWYFNEYSHIVLHTHTHTHKHYLFIVHIVLGNTSVLALLVRCCIVYVVCKA